MGKPCPAIFSRSSTIWMTNCLTEGQMDTERRCRDCGISVHPRSTRCRKCAALRCGKIHADRQLKSRKCKVCGTNEDLVRGRRLCRPCRNLHQRQDNKINREKRNAKRREIYRENIEARRALAFLDYWKNHETKKAIARKSYWRNRHARLERMGQRHAERGGAPFHFEYREGGEDNRTGYFSALTDQISDAEILEEIFSSSSKTHRRILESMLDNDSDIDCVAKELGITNEDVQATLGEIRDGFL